MALPLAGLSTLPGAFLFAWRVEGMGEGWGWAGPGSSALRSPRTAAEATSPLRVEEAEGAGRFFVAARPIASGERLLVGVPEACDAHEPPRHTLPCAHNSLT